MSRLPGRLTLIEASFELRVILSQRTARLPYRFVLEPDSGYSLSLMETNQYASGTACE